MPFLKADLTVEVEATVLAPNIALTATSRYDVERREAAVAVMFRPAGARAVVAGGPAGDGDAMADRWSHVRLNIAAEARRLGWVEGKDVSMRIEAGSLMLTFS